MSKGKPKPETPALPECPKCRGGGCKACDFRGY
jgi:hypothetical protein